MCKITHLNSFPSTVSDGGDVTGSAPHEPVPGRLTHPRPDGKPRRSPPHRPVRRLPSALDPLRNIPSQPKHHYPHARLPGGVIERGRAALGADARASAQMGTPKPAVPQGAWGKESF